MTKEVKEQLDILEMKYKTLPLKTVGNLEKHLVTELKKTDFGRLKIVSIQKIINHPVLLVITLPSHATSAAGAITYALKIKRPDTGDSGEVEIYSDIFEDNQGKFSRQDFVRVVEQIIEKA